MTLNLHSNTYLFPNPELLFFTEYITIRYAKCLPDYLHVACSSQVEGKFQEGRNCFHLLLCQKSQKESQVPIKNL